MGKELGSKYRAQSWLGVWELADWIRILSFWSSRALQRQECYLSSCLPMWHTGQEGLHLGARNLFQCMDVHITKNDNRSHDAEKDNVSHAKSSMSESLGQRGPQILITRRSEK